MLYIWFPPISDYLGFFFMSMPICCPHKCLDGAETEATDISDTRSS